MHIGRDFTLTLEGPLGQFFQAKYKPNKTTTTFPHEKLPKMTQICFVFQAKRKTNLSTLKDKTKTKSSPPPIFTPPIFLPG